MSSSVSKSQTFTGSFNAFEPDKNFGVTPSGDLDEDVFYLHAELPAEVKGISDRKRVIG